MCRLVVASDRPHQGSRRTLSLKVAVVVWKIFHGERHVGIFEELVVLISVEIEGSSDKHFGSNSFPYPSRQFCLRARYAAYRHGAVQAEIDTVEWAFGFDLSDHLANKRFIGVESDPSGSGTSFWPQRRLDANQFDPFKFPRHLHEAAHISFGIKSQQSIAFGRQPGIDEVFERRIVFEKRDCLVGKMQHSDAYRRTIHWSSPFSQAEAPLVCGVLGRATRKLRESERPTQPTQRPLNCICASTPHCVRRSHRKPGRCIETLLPSSCDSSRKRNCRSQQANW